MDDSASSFQGGQAPLLNNSAYNPLSIGDHDRSAVFSISNPAKDFYSSVGTVDETSGGLSTIHNEFRSRSSTPSTISVSSLPQIPSRPSFGSLVPSLGEVEASLKNLITEQEGQVHRSIRCAWIPSERTSAALHAIASNVPASDFIGADQLTKVGIMSDKLFVNPAFDLAMRFIGTIPATMLPETPDQMISANDFRGLLSKGFFSSAANVCAKLLYAFDQGYGRAGQTTVKHSEQSLIIWAHRISALVMLEQVELAAKELEAFGDLENPDLFFDYCSQTSGDKLSGSMVPFPLRLLHARIPQRLGTPKITLDRLFTIKTTIETMLNNASSGHFPPNLPSHLHQQFIETWQARRVSTLYHIIAATIQCEDFDTAIRLLRVLLKLCPEKQGKIWHQLGLLYCHIGTFRSARVCFSANEAATDEHLDHFRSLHIALLTVCEGSPVTALECFESMFKTSPEDSAAANGIAIGHFYAGRMADAMIFLENLVLSQPRIFLTEQSLRNLVAMYELQNIQVRERKLRLLSLICQYCPDGRGVNLLKLADS